MLLVSVNRCEMTSLLQNYLLLIFMRDLMIKTFMSLSLKNPSRLEHSLKTPNRPRNTYKYYEGGILVPFAPFIFI